MGGPCPPVDRLACHTTCLPQVLAQQLAVDGRKALAVAMEAIEEEALEGTQVAEVTVTLCSDERIRELNQEWRGEDKATDVLSFPQDQPAGMTPVVSEGRSLRA